MFQAPLEVPVHSSQADSLIQTFLRPDFHQWFPVFTPEEMRERLAAMPFELATLLRPRNIRQAIQIDSGWRYLRYLRQPPAVKQALLSEVLQSRSIPKPVAEAVAYKRHRFVGPSFRATAYMDRSLPVAGQTYLSAPSLVALMLSMSADLKPEPMVCEIGVGTGLHAIALSRLMPGAFVTGVDRSRQALHLATANIERAGMQRRFSLHEDMDTDWAVANADFVYATAALSQAQLARLVRFGRQGSTWLVPRQLTRQEFESEPAHSWLWQAYGSYDGYCAGAWNQYLAVERFELVPSGRRRTVAVVYDVRFVRYTE
jgi:protein-L-isoaspartate O-methyltransferase